VVPPTSTVLRPHPLEAIQQSLETRRPFLCALALGRANAVEVSGDHQCEGILGSSFEQVERS